MTSWIRLLIYISLFLSSHITFAGDCEGPEGSSRWEACTTHKESNEIEIKLNEKYKEKLQLYKNNGLLQHTKLLIEAERAWLVYRDKTCKFENEALGGINSIPWTRCHYRLTKERLEYFENAYF